MLDLLRRVDFLLGADASSNTDTKAVLSQWFDTLMLFSCITANHLNKMTYVQLTTPDFRSQAKEELKKLMNEYMIRANLFHTLAPQIPEKNRIQFTEALLCHIYHQISDDVRWTMVGDNFIRDSGFFQQISLMYVHNSRCMKTKADVLEYALCHDTSEYWKNYDDGN